MKYYLITLSWLTIVVACCSRPDSKPLNPGSETKQITGLYNIDGARENMHTFKHFKINLEVENDSIKLIFKSSEQFGYSHLWKEGDVYAFTDNVNSITDTIPLKLYENRGDNKVLTDYRLVMGENSFQIMAVGKGEIEADHFIKIDPNSKTTITFSSLNSRNATIEELKEIDSEYQAGMELASWLAQLDTQLTTDDLVIGISKSLDSINGVKFPIAEYNNYRDLTQVLGYTFGEVLHKEFNWNWVYIESVKNEYVGWTIVSPGKQLGVKIEDLFYQYIMYSKDIKLLELYDQIKRNEIDGSKSDEFKFYEPWMND
jgi:hypothetical protein